MIRSFRDNATEDISNGRDTRVTRRWCPPGLWRVAGRKLEHIDSVVRLDELRMSPGIRLEALAGDRVGQFSIRINDQYRICFTWTEAGPADVEIVDYH
jgi:proteic killer suppression protein